MVSPCGYPNDSKYCLDDIIIGVPIKGHPYDNNKNIIWWFKSLKISFGTPERFDIWTFKRHLRKINLDELILFYKIIKKN